MFNTSSPDSIATFRTSEPIETRNQFPEPVRKPWEPGTCQNPFKPWNHLPNARPVGTHRNLEAPPAQPIETWNRFPEPGSFPEPPHLAQSTPKSILCKDFIAFCCWGKNTLTLLARGVLGIVPPRDSAATKKRSTKRNHAFFGGQKRMPTIFLKNPGRLFRFSSPKKNVGNKGNTFNYLYHSWLAFCGAGPVSGFGSRAIYRNSTKSEIGYASKV